MWTLTDFMKTDLVILDLGTEEKKYTAHSDNTVCTNTISNSIGKPDVDVWIDRNCAKSALLFIRIDKNMLCLNT